MTPQKIGHGKLRITVRSAPVRRRLAAVPGVEVHGDRVIFPEDLEGAVTAAIHSRAPRRAKPRTQQIGLGV